MRLIPILLWVSLHLTAVAASVAQSPDADSIIARVEGAQSPNRQGLDGYTIPELMQRFRVPGVSIAVIHDHKVHWVRTYGVADATSGVKVTPATRFQAASISKPVTAMAAMRLVQDGRLSLDDDVNNILRSWTVPASEHTRERPVTPRSLFSHTSGADDGFGFPGYAPGATLPSAVQVIRGDAPSPLGAVRFVRPPFAAMKYSGGGTTIMQVALADLTGEPFASLLQRLVLGPLEMTNSSYEQPPPAALEGALARAHNGGGARMADPWHVYAEQAAAGLWTTPSDLARWVIEVQRANAGPRGAVLTQASVREMLSPVGVGPFAVGLQVEKRGEGWYFSHGGANWGFRADVLGHVRKGYGVVVMTNGDNGGPVISEIEARVAAAYNWDSLHKPVLR